MGTRPKTVSAHSAHPFLPFFSLPKTMGFRFFFCTMSHQTLTLRPLRRALGTGGSTRRRTNPKPLAWGQALSALLAVWVKAHILRVSPLQGICIFR